MVRGEKQEQESKKEEKVKKRVNLYIFPRVRNKVK